MWVRRPGPSVEGQRLLKGCEGLLRNNMKEKKVLVVTVVRGAKVDIAPLIAGDAALRAVQALEKRSHGKAWFG